MYDLILSMEEEEKEKLTREKKDNKCHCINWKHVQLLFRMSTRNDLTLEQKINLIKQNKGGSSYRELCDKFKISIGSVSNVIKIKTEYLNDYEINLNKKIKRKTCNDFSRSINELVYEWFIAQRAKNIPVSGPI